MLGHNEQAVSEQPQQAILFETTSVPANAVCTLNVKNEGKIHLISAYCRYNTMWQYNQWWHSCSARTTK
jgi:hypothetical protein